MKGHGVTFDLAVVTLNYKILQFLHSVQGHGVTFDFAVVTLNFKILQFLHVTVHLQNCKFNK